MKDAAKDSQHSLDRHRALDAFHAYVAAYDPTNPRIALKVAHTLRVAGLCERIARSIPLDSDDVDLAWLLGLVHDIGRFEQVKRYDTFNDAASVDHAALGAEVLFEVGADGIPLIRRFADCEADDELIRTVVKEHSSYRVPAGLDTRAHTLCDVLRDADKIDILQVNCTSPIEDIYGISEQTMLESALSPECVEIYYDHRCLPRGTRRFPADVMLGHICFVWELVYDESLRIIREQGHLRKMLDREWTNPDTAQSFREMAAHMKSERAI